MHWRRGTTPERRLLNTLSTDTLLVLAGWLSGPRESCCGARLYNAAASSVYRQGAAEERGLLALGCADGLSLLLLLLTTHCLTPSSDELLPHCLPHRLPGSNTHPHALDVPCLCCDLLCARRGSLSQQAGPQRLRLSSVILRLAALWDKNALRQVSSVALCF